jgi:hypothetical protein
MDRTVVGPISIPSQTSRLSPGLEGPLLSILIDGRLPFMLFHFPSLFHSQYGNIYCRNCSGVHDHRILSRINLSRRLIHIGISVLRDFETLATLPNDEMGFYFQWGERYALISRVEDRFAFVHLDDGNASRCVDGSFRDVPTSALESLNSLTCIHLSLCFC